MDRSKAINGVTGAELVGGGAKAPSYPADGNEVVPQDAVKHVYERSDGRRVDMTTMNPHHRARAAEKAAREGNEDLAAKLRASGPLE